MEHCQGSIKCKLWCKNKIIYNTAALKPNLCDLKNAYIWVRGDIVTAASNFPKKIWPSRFGLTFLEKIKETTLKFFQESKRVLLIL